MSWQECSTSAIKAIVTELDEVFSRVSNPFFNPHSPSLFAIIIHFFSLQFRAACFMQSIITWWKTVDNGDDDVRLQFYLNITSEAICRLYNLSHLTWSMRELHHSKCKWLYKLINTLCRAIFRLILQLILHAPFNYFREIISHFQNFNKWQRIIISKNRADMFWNN